jgi:hypothetical protein
VLIHELAHLRRRDHWVGWLQVLATCLWWWHPLFWYVRRQLRANAELACDAWVLWALPDGRRAYAEALIEVSERVSRLAAPVPALGMGGSRRDFERRLTMIMRETVPCRVSRGGLVALGALALVVLPAWSLAQDKKPEDNAVQKRLPVDDKQSLPDTGRRDERLPVQKPPRADNNATGIRAGASLVGARDANHVGAVSGADRDRRLAAVEQQLQALLNEVRSLRGGAVNQQQYRQALVDSVLRPTAGADKAPVLEGPDAKPVAGRDGVQVITLTRATYKLPQSRAAALSEFLREHVKVEMLDLKVRGNELTVTTTPEAQKAIGQLIRLMRTDEPAKKDYYEKKS